MSTERLFQAVRSGDLSDVHKEMQLQGHCKDISLPKSGDTPLHIAAGAGHEHILEYILRDCKGDTQVDVQNFHGKTPLHEAAQMMRHNCVKYLIQQGANVNSMKISDWTPLMLACTKHGNIRVVECLVAAGADVTLRNKDGWNAFHIACREGDIAVVRYLLTVDVATAKNVSKNGRTPLHTAALHGHVEVVKILVELSGELCSVCDSCGSTPIFEAVRANREDIVDFLALQNIGMLDHVDKSGFGVLHIVAQTGHVDMLKHLITHYNCDVNQKSNRHGVVPLHVACKEGHVDVALELAKNGANVLATDNKGHSALEVARNIKHKQLIQHLENCL